MMHPDAQAVANDIWSPNSPIERRGYVTLDIISKRMNIAPDTDADGADAIAGALISNPRFVKSYVTLFNKQAVRSYTGTGLTDLAVRRG